MDGFLILKQKKQSRLFKPDIFFIYAEFTQLYTYCNKVYKYNRALIRDDTHYTILSPGGILGVHV